MTDYSDIDRAAGYIRVSTEKQKKEERHKDQEALLERWSAENNIDIDIYRDIAISGQSNERPGYDKLMNQLDIYDAVVVRRLSRFGRDLQTVLSDIETLDEMDTAFISLKEDFIDTSSASGQLFMQIVGAFNEFQANMARERTLAAIERAEEKDKGWGAKKKLGPSQVDQVLDWRSNGLSYDRIAMLVEMDTTDLFSDVDSISSSTIYSYCQEHMEEESQE